MKKLSLLLAVVMVLSMLAACTPAPTPPVTTQAPPAATNPPVTDPPETTEPIVTQPAFPATFAPDAQVPEKTCNLTVTAAEDPQAQFAADEIMAAAKQHEILDNWEVKLEAIDSSLGTEAYKIEVEGTTVTVTGGDATGLMYGGLEVAEQLSLGGVEGLKDASGTPYVESRGLKLNIPLDMRTPSYADAGDSAQLNIETMWDMDFWTAYFDAMARNRYNAITLWNLNPFPSMVKVEDYPDVALDDVWKTTVPFDDSYSLSGINAVEEVHWENYEVVKEITIDEKIEFWKEVMAYAKSRGIKFYIVTWNIYTYGEHGKYGITAEIDNQTTIDYYRKSVAAMVETYPDLAGIGVTAGENMDWAPGMETLNEQWLYDTYGMGITDALQNDPDRDFTLIHRLHLTEFEMVNDIWKDFPGKLEYCENYAAAHMYADVAPNLIDDTLAVMPEGDRLWLTLRSDDFYFLRWGDPDYARDYILNMPAANQLAGYMMGGDGYIPAVEYSDVDARFQGQLSIEKQWYTYLLWGRLGYDPTLTNEHFSALLKNYYDTIPEDYVEKLDEAYRTAGKILPLVSRLFFLRGDAAWYPEAATSHPVSSGYITIKRWAASENVMEGADVISILDYVKQSLEGVSEFEQLTPAEITVLLREYANTTLELIKDIPITQDGTRQEVEFSNAVTDQKAMALLGLYYAEKIDGALKLTYYNQTEDTAYQDAAIANLTQCLEYWKEYAALFHCKYLPQRLGRQGYIDMNQLAVLVEEDISLAESWRVRKK